MTEDGYQVQKLFQTFKVFNIALGYERPTNIKIKFTNGKCQDDLEICPTAVV